MEAERAVAELRAALAAAEDTRASPAERAEMLMEIAMGLQQRPTPEQLGAAVSLYERALQLCPEAQPLLRARIGARRGTALQALPGEGTEALEAARAAHEGALPALRELGRPEEVAEGEMNLGLVLQTLAAAGRARMTDAIAAYQRSLRTFDKARFPREFAILQNNLATSFLSMAVGSDPGGRMREAMAVAAFEEGLRAVTLIDHPAEYAMLQNNLGNALQYASSSHLVENNLRALEAYDEALKVRTRESMPLEYANTIANRANCLRNLPDDASSPELGAKRNLLAARAAYLEARALFAAHGEHGKARLVGEAGEQIDRELLGGFHD